MRIADCQTLYEVYNYIKRPHVFIETPISENSISAEDFNKTVEGILCNLQKMGMKPGDELIFQIKDNNKFISIFWACILGKIIPVPYTYLENEREQSKLLGVWEKLKNPYLVIDEKSFQRIEQNLDLKVNPILSVIKKKALIIEKIERLKGKIIYEKPDEDDIAFIQFSSGSTSEPKGVVITHKNIMTSVRATIKAMKVSEKDVYLSWLPLTHSFGLIGTYLTPLIAECDFYIMPSSLFVGHPLLWLEKISEHRVTITASPNFGLKHVCRYIKFNSQIDINLSSLRIIIDGAEPVSAKVCEEFIEMMSRYRLKCTAVRPSYGLSEATLVVSTPKGEQKYTEVFVERKHVRVGEPVIEVEKENDNTMRFVEVGACLDNIEAKIVDDRGKVLGNRTVGHLLLRGESIFKGYYNNNQATKVALNSEGWLDTGDLGFFRDENLVLTGREKDVIFVKGENYYSYDIENLCSEISGEQFSKVAICADYSKQEERVICFVEYQGEKRLFNDIAKRIKKHILYKVGIGIAEVIPVEKIPVTVSGKLKRYILLEKYRETVDS